MISIGIESTAHTIGIGLVDEHCRILANESSTVAPETGGIHPREAANHHAERIVPLIHSAVEKAKIDFDDLDVIAVSIGPGLGPCLRTGMTAARALSLVKDKPLIGVNHCVAHLEIGRIRTGCKSPILLYVSGGNTQVIAFTEGRYRVFGETLDIGIGNLLDKFSRAMNLGFPGGPEVEKIALQGKEFIELPYSVKGMDVAFSGMLTAALESHKRGASIQNLCYSIQEIAFAMLTEVSERAMAHLNREEILLGGGVACNHRLQSMVLKMATDRGAKMYVPEDNLCVDNGAMIAWTGLLMFRSGHRLKINESFINQRYRTDQVEVTWI